MKVQSFDSDEEMLEAMKASAQAGRRAYDSMPPLVRAALVPGLHYTQMGPDFPIFGIIKDPDESGDNLDREPWLRLVEAWSVATFGGSDVGTAYAGNLMPIPDAVFAWFQAREWNAESLGDPEKQELIALVQPFLRDPVMCYGVAYLIQTVLA